MIEAWLRMELQVWDLILVEQISVSSMGSSGVHLTKEVTMSMTKLFLRTPPMMYINFGDIDRLIIGTFCVWHLYYPEIAILKL